MSDSYVKLATLLKRKQGMSVEDFQRYYENHHAKLIRLLPGVRRYFRRYLHPLAAQPVHIDKPQDEQEFDVITELWFATRQDMETALARLAEPEIAAIFREDEEKLFDRSRRHIRTYMIEKECPAL